MLISHEYQFIFVKTRKTAGTSVEIALSRYLGPADVITPISPRDEVVRAAWGIQPRNYLVAKHRPYVGTPDEPIVAAALNQVEVERAFYNHCPAAEIRQKVGEGIWDRYVKFCFERNPWDRVLSEYFYVQKHQAERFGQMSLRDYVLGEHYTLNAPLYVIDGRSAMNIVGRYETLAADLQHICGQLGIPYDDWLPHAKGDTRPPDTRSPQRLLTPDLQDRIAERCRAEIELFGYAPPRAA
jgi:hypothetical protein